MNDLTTIIKTLDLKPHPEGGYFKETYRSQAVISANELGEEYGDERHFSTCIYYLLTSDGFSAFHKIKQDEAWHFYQGSAIELHQISAIGKYEKFIIGSDIAQGQLPQLIVPGDHWFAARVINPNQFSLLGCTVAPGFDFRDFVLADRQFLIADFPQHQDIITQLTRD